MKKIIILILLRTLSLNLTAQEAATNAASIDSIKIFRSSEENPCRVPNIPNFIISPSRAEFDRYGEHPIDLTTGVSNITIPIYTIEIGDFSLPIDLKYHSGGNKVEDVPSHVGLGWSLICGGSIHQQIYDIQEPNIEDIHLEYGSSDAAYKQLNQDRFDYGRLNLNWGRYVDEPAPARFQLRPNRFVYKFADKYSVFKYNPNTKLYETIPHSPVKIDMDMYHDKKDEKKKGIITIIDENGISWIFKGYMPIREYRSVEEDIEYKLVKIQFPNSIDFINFFYEGPRFREITSNRVDMTEVGLIPTIFTMPLMATLFCEYEEEVKIAARYKREKLSYEASKKEYIDYPLSKITWKKNSIEFNYLNDRVDFVQNSSGQKRPRLASIHVINSESERIKEVNLGNQDSYLGTDKYDYRMLLRSLKTEGQTHEFGYNESIILPRGFNTTPKHNESILCNVDFWGYYNGRGSSEWDAFEWNYDRGSLEANYVPNRESDSRYTQAGILQRITYPTKGYTIFEYEQNISENVYTSLRECKKSVNIISSTYSLPSKQHYEQKTNLPINSMQDCGGLRISRVLNYDYDSDNTLLTKQSYKYHSKKPYVKLTPDLFIKDKISRIGIGTWVYSNNSCNLFISYPSTQYDLITTLSNGVYPLYDPSFQSVFYDHISVIQENLVDNSFAIETEYEYDANPIHPSFTNTLDRGITRPRLISKKEYRIEKYKKELVREKYNKYKTIDGLEPYKSGVYIKNDNIYTSRDSETVRKHGLTEYYNGFDIQDAYVYPYVWILDSTSIIQYERGNKIETQETYKYDIEHKTYFMISNMKRNSNDVQIIEKLSYPFHQKDNQYLEMTSKNMLAPIIERSRNVSNSILTVRTDYVKIMNKFFPSTISFGTNNDVDERIKFWSYDSYGNPISISKDKSESVVYIWSYDGQYPIAEIRNAKLEDITAALQKQGKTIDGLANMIMPNWDVDKFRNDLSSALITTYTYKPLVGMLTSTDPSGHNYFYEYDAFNRLQHTYIKDEDNKEQYIENYEYNYRKNKL